MNKLDVINMQVGKKNSNEYEFFLLLIIFLVFVALYSKIIKFQDIE